MPPTYLRVTVDHTASHLPRDVDHLSSAALGQATTDWVRGCLADSTQFAAVGTRDYLMAALPGPDDNPDVLCALDVSAAVVARGNASSIMSVVLDPRLVVSRRLEVDLSPAAAAAFERGDCVTVGDPDVVSGDFVAANCDADVRCVTFPELRPAVVQTVSRRLPTIDFEHRRVTGRSGSDAGASAHLAAIAASLPNASRAAVPTDASDCGTWCVLTLPGAADDGTDDESPRRIARFVLPDAMLLRDVHISAERVHPARRGIAARALAAAVAVMARHGANVAAEEPAFTTGGTLAATDVAKASLPKRAPVGTKRRRAD